jgi:hypothetical protein
MLSKILEKEEKIKTRIHYAVLVIFIVLLAIHLI